jgi:hypothetical protein
MENTIEPNPINTARRRRTPIRVIVGNDPEPTRALIIDAMSRQIEAGDIINWRSGGYFGHYMAFGMVTQVDYDKGCIKVINHNNNRVTMWNTHMCVILAKANDYSNIPEEYINLWLTDD